MTSLRSSLERMRWLWRLAAVAAGAALLTVPALAEACPSCARDSGGAGRIVLLSAMILFPFAVVGVTLRAVRRAAQPVAAAPEDRS